MKTLIYKAVNNKSKQLTVSEYISDLVAAQIESDMNNGLSVKQVKTKYLSGSSAMADIESETIEILS